MDVRPFYERTLTESELLEQLPNELTSLIQSASGTQQLHALAQGALNTRLTETVFRTYEPIAVDLAARWIRKDFQADPIQILAAFARILPLAPYLRPFAGQYALSKIGPLSALAGSKELTLRQLDQESIRTLLLALFRLLSFDLETFSKAVSPIQLQSLFPHEDPITRYLAIRCFAIYMHAADAATQSMLRINTGVDPIEGNGREPQLTIAYWAFGRSADGKPSTKSCEVKDSHSQIKMRRQSLSDCGVLSPANLLMYAAF
ncbi:Midasin [Penicillium chermesinum]|nr:Midasin [Penicillium chermesinum]